MDASNTDTNAGPAFPLTGGVVAKRDSVPSYAHFSVVNCAFAVRTLVRQAIWPERGPPHGNFYSPFEYSDDTRHMIVVIGRTDDLTQADLDQLNELFVARKVDAFATSMGSLLPAAYPFGAGHPPGGTLSVAPQTRVKIDHLTHTTVTKPCPPLARACWVLDLLAIVRGHARVTALGLSKGRVYIAFDDGYAAALAALSRVACSIVPYPPRGMTYTVSTVIAKDEEHLVAIMTAQAFCEWVQVKYPGVKPLDGNRRTKTGYDFQLLAPVGIKVPTDTVQYGGRSFTVTPTMGRRANADPARQASSMPAQAARPAAAPASPPVGGFHTQHALTQRAHDPSVKIHPGMTAVVVSTSGAVGPAGMFGVPSPVPGDMSGVLAAAGAASSPEQGGSHPGRGMEQ